jgi:hypothetical protein
MKKSNDFLELFSTLTPEDLKIKLLDIGVTLRHINNHIHKYFYVINKIYTNNAVFKDQDLCRLNTRDLKRKFGGRYSHAIVSNLVKTNIIKLQSNYYVGVQSKGYILCEPIGAKLYKFENTKFARKIKEDEIKLIETHTQTLARLYRSLTRLETDHIDINSLNEVEYMSLKILKNNPFQKVGKLGGRLYNNFCNLPKTLRSKLKLNNELLGFVDIVNSQMVFLGGVIKDYLVVKNIDFSESTTQFIKLSCDGLIYNQFMELIGNSDRAEVKEMVFSIIFSEKSYSKDLGSVFKREYPQVYEVINSIKRDNYKVLAHQMQQKEAKVVFRALDAIDSTLDVLTIHDSLYAPISHLNIIKGALIDSFKAEGINCAINVNDEEVIIINNVNSSQIELVSTSTSEIKFLKKIKELKEKKERKKRIGVKGFVELATIIDFNIIPKEKIKKKIEELVDCDVKVISEYSMFVFMDFAFHHDGIYVNLKKRNDPENIKKIKIILNQEKRIHVIA